MSPSGYPSPRGGNVTIGPQSTNLISPRGQSPSFAGDGDTFHFIGCAFVSLLCMYQCACRGFNVDAGQLVRPFSLMLTHT